ncbi:MAG: hypothetical protein QGM50_10875 [Anaerolineae bacterium]|nr:hypothetical protein [Anaerolineae bacterium]MDK1082089.1 hypothetical protein [Anaerolineae bacterium]MDK1119273.1 hypothetical protein [Anaerolineae bacterium]
MVVRQLILVLIGLVLTTACGAQASPVVEPVKPEAPAEVQSDNEPAAGTAAPNCLGETISPIGQSIAEDYETASYEQVMIWFCNGAEFEDILVALETETLTDRSADEMLKMLADGLIWDEIWQIAGLTN